MVTLKPNQLLKKISANDLFITEEGDCFGDHVMIVKTTPKKIEIATGDAGDGEAKIFSFELSAKTKRFFNINFENITVGDLPHFEKELHQIEFKDVRRNSGIEGAGFTSSTLKSMGREDDLRILSYMNSSINVSESQSNKFQTTLNPFTANLYVNKKKVLRLTDDADGTGVFCDFGNGFDEQSETYQNTIETLKKLYGEPFCFGNSPYVDEDLLLALFSYMSMYVFLNKSFSQYVEDMRKEWRKNNS